MRPRLAKVQVAGVVVGIGAGVVAFEYFRSPIIGVLTVIGAVVAGMGKRHKGGITILALVAVIAASTAPQTASALSGGPAPRWWQTTVPASCLVQGPPTPGYADHWWLDPLYRSCLDSPTPDWLRRCVVGAVILPTGNGVGMAMTSKSVAQWASKVGEVTPVGLLIGLSAGCALGQIKAAG